MNEEMPPAANEEKPCRHEYVRIFQRKLKGLERRLVRQRAFSPVGNKMGDFNYLGENSYCFCSKCRARLYPKRSQTEKLAAKQALAQGRLLAGMEVTAEIVEALNDSINESTAESSETAIDIHVEELELESIDAQDIAAEGVKLAEEEEECSLMDEDI